MTVSLRRPSPTPSPLLTWTACIDAGEPDRRRGRLAGPWKIEPVPGPDPGRSPCSRQWEELAAGDSPSPSSDIEETARLLAVLLSIVDRESLFYLEEGETAEGYPLIAVYGEQGPQVAGWLDRCEPRWARGFSFWRRSSVRRSLRDLLEAAGPGAEEQVGRIRARHQRA